MGRVGDSFSRKCLLFLSLLLSILHFHFQWVPWYVYLLAVETFRGALVTGEIPSNSSRPGTADNSNLWELLEWAKSIASSFKWSALSNVRSVIPYCFLLSTIIVWSWAILRWNSILGFLRHLIFSGYQEFLLWSAIKRGNYDFHI